MKRGASPVAPELQRIVEEAKERLAQTREQVHKARAQEVREEPRAIETGRDELASELAKVLNEHTRLHGEYMEAARQYFQDDTNYLAQARLTM